MNDRRLLDRLDGAVLGQPFDAGPGAEPGRAAAASDVPDWAVVARGLHRLGHAQGGRRLSLVIDTAPGMALWQPVTSRLRALLRGQRGLCVREFPWDGVQEPLRPDGRGPDRFPAGSENRLILVVTDALAPAWRDGTAQAAIAGWAARHPVACLHLLPQRLWSRSGLPMRRIRLAAPGPGREPPGILVGDNALAPHDTPLPGGTVPLPLLPLRGRWLARWARWLTGAADGWTELPTHTIAPGGGPEPQGASGAAYGNGPAYGEGPAYREGPTYGEGPASEEALAAPPSDPASRIAAYRAGCSAAGSALAPLLAAAPLTLPVIRTLCERFAPGTGPADLAELAAFGLLVPVAGEDGRFDMDDGSRALLLDGARRTDTQRVLLALDDLVPAAARMRRGGYFRAVVTSPKTVPIPEVNAANSRLLRIEQLALRALAGPFQERARLLDRALAHWHSTPHTADSTAFQARGGSMTSAPVPSGNPPRDPQTPRHAASSPAVWENVPPRNPNFTGREQLLTELVERLDSGGTAAVLPEAMYGLGGIGKSQLAVEYVYRHQSAYDLICWISSEHTSGIINALAQLAPRLGISHGSETSSTVPAVLDALRRGEPYSRWLLVFDNAENAETLAPFLPNSRLGTVLITSRNPHWDNVARCLEVDVFERAESINLLNKRGPELSHEDADLLAEALGDLPLAIEQAAAWRAETGMPVQEYLRLFKEKRSELLFESAPYAYQQSIATAWNVSLDHVEQTNPEAIQLLQVCAYLAPEPIPRDLFSHVHRSSIAPQLDAALADPLRLSRAVREIKRYSLARVDLRTNSILIHRLVQAVLINRMTPLQQEQMKRGAQLLLATADPRNPESNATWNRYSVLYPHAVAAGTVRSTDPWVHGLVVNIAKYLQRWGDHESALRFTGEAYDAARELFGPDDEKTLTLAFWLGWILFSTGHYTEAAEINKVTLAAYESAQRPSPVPVSETRESHLDAMGAVAADLRVKGDFEDALALTQRVYEQATAAFGHDDPATMNAAHNLGVCLRLVGRFQDAYELDRTTWELKQTLFGTDHELTLLTRVGLTIDERELGRYAHARDRQEEVVAQYERQVQADTPATLHAKRVLAVARRKAGDHRAALEVSEEVLDVMVSRFGQEHPDTIAASLSLSVDLRHDGQLERARELAEACCRRYRRIFGPQHPHTVSAEANLAITLRLDGRPQQAYDLDLRAHAALSENLGERHPLTLVVATNQASDLAALERYEEALELGTATLARCTEVLGPVHPSTLSTAANRALDLHALERRGECDALHTAILDELRAQLGDTHPAATNLANWTRANCYIDPLPL
ncbi:FxSxx-COOH system tetratricopeptide repeat protein [Streptomyces sp. NBC_01381]|uniref:FxSxx-COOH system tetratricopeptide repeat protein n=1 Tax=Streptomyces sp. NBC_01381 TaxID=2903845 RepID=UPI0022570DCF|nr:FxSxx-COOH system tetratricopeptide repeat protein [Streptomyces sp. NBC_01381]MCX4673150.1 FxSxx-COOH system tetratricopeptide repeat protein [Streptomyces sp. NBC_01381]